MRRLAKGGFSQSYTYFTWRNTKQELIDYFTELTQTDSAEIMRPNLFANTPDILPEYLQYGGRAAFQIRLVLAATLGATYGIYGPPFELSVGQAVRHGSEEYLDSEKYQVRHWDRDDPASLRDYIARINAIRRENPALAPRSQPAVLPLRQRPDPLLRQGDARPVEHRPGGRQPRPASRPVGLGAGPAGRAGPGRPGRASRSRSTT